MSKRISLVAREERGKGRKESYQAREAVPS